MQEDTQRRGLAYHVAHAHRRIKLYRSMDPSEQAGKELGNRMKNDPVASDMKLPTFEYQKLILNLENMLRRPEYLPIEQEWQRMTSCKKGKLNWFSLFEGPANIESLANRLGLGMFYEFLYRNWSNTIHAANCMEFIAKNSEASGNAIRPLRHPEGLEQVIVIGVGMCRNLWKTLLDGYGNQQEFAAIQAVYTERIRPLESRLRSGPIINVAWH
jgi:hypothetical protein